jgi:ribosomal protein L16 Arg81 hydroxylase
MLKKLIDPISEEIFFAEYWEKKPLLIQRQDPDYFSDLISLDLVDQILSSRKFLKGSTRIVNVTESNFCKDGEVNSRLMLRYYEEGKTLVIQQAQLLLESIRKFCHELKHSFPNCHWSNTNVYITPTQGIGFEPHYDAYEVFVTQVEGSKLWKIFEQPVELPIQDFKTAFPDGFNPGKLTNEFELFPGDTLYMPGGLAHAAQCQQGYSMHLTFGLVMTSFFYLLKNQLENMTEKYPENHLSLPFSSYFDSPSAGGENQNEEQVLDWYKNCLEQLFDPELLSKSVKNLSNSRRENTEIFLEGQLNMMDLIRKKKLSLKSQIQSRDLFLPYTSENISKKGFVELSFHDTRMSVTEDHKKAFQFLISTEKCRIQDIPGKLSNKEKIEFVKTLIEECVVSIV